MCKLTRSDIFFLPISASVAENTVFKAHTVRRQVLDVLRIAGSTLYSRQGLCSGKQAFVDITIYNYRILLLDCIDIKIIQEALKAKSIKIPKKKLCDILDSCGVTWCDPWQQSRKRKKRRAPVNLSQHRPRRKNTRI